MRSQTVLAVIATVLLFSCSDNVDRIRISDISLNIVDAQSVAVVENPIGGRMSETSNNLYKLTTDGSFESVKFINANGTDINPNKVETAIEVHDVFDLSASYLLLTGHFTIYKEESDQYYDYTGLLVRKEDGAIYNFNNYEYRLKTTGGRKGEKVFKYDALNNIYFPTYNNYGVTKLIIDNPDAVSTIDFLPTGQKGYHFDIAPNGSCIYSYELGHGGRIRLKKPNGGIFEVKIDERVNVDNWIGNNGSIYFASRVHGYDPVRDDYDFACMIHKIYIMDDEVAIDTVWADESFDYSVVASAYGSHRIQRENSVVFLNSGKGFEFFEETNTVDNILLPDFADKSKIANSAEFFYIASGTDLYKGSFETHEYVKLLKTGEYEVYSLNVDENDTVFFSGLRFKDGKMIFAEIDSEGNLTVVDEELGRKATMLQRLN